MGEAWDRLPGAAVPISVDCNGLPWVMNDQHNIHRWATGAGERLLGKANNIACGGGEVWVSGTNRVQGGFGIQCWAGQSWENVPGGAVRIAVDDRGTLWVVNEAGTICRG